MGGVSAPAGLSGIEAAVIALLQGILPPAEAPSRAARRHRADLENYIS